MNVQIQFNHTADIWYGRLVREGTDDIVFFLDRPRHVVKLARKIGLGPEIKSTVEMRAAGCVEEASDVWLKKENTNAFLPWPAPIHDMDQKMFEDHFIRCVREYIYQQAARHRRIVRVSNFRDQIETAEYHFALGKRLKKKTNPAKHSRRRNLEMLLIHRWVRDRLYLLNRTELAEHMNVFFDGQPFTKHDVWKTAYGLGLISESTSGPRPRVA